MDRINISPSGEVHTIEKVVTHSHKITNQGGILCRWGWHKWVKFEIKDKLNGEHCVRCMKCRNMVRLVPSGKLAKYEKVGNGYVRR